MLHGKLADLELWSDEIAARTIEFVLAPKLDPDLLPSVLPLILGAVIIELYLGRHSREVLGWNTSVGNAIIWVSTGLNLLLTERLGTPLEESVVWLVLLTGAFTAYMDFFHKWSEAVAFRVSSPDIIYPLAYVAVVAVKTEMPVDPVTIKAALWFLAAVSVTFAVVKVLVTPVEEETSFDLR